MWVGLVILITEKCVLEKEPHLFLGEEHWILGVPDQHTPEPRKHIALAWDLLSALCGARV